MVHDVKQSHGKPVRVALVGTSIEFGGIERVLLNLLEHMDGEVQFIPILFTRTDTKDKSFFERLRGLGLVPRIIYVNSFRPKYANAAWNVVEGISALRNEQFDLIHSHGYRADVISLALSKYFRKPLVSTCHGFVPNDRRLRFYNDLDLRLLRYFARIIAVSTSMRWDLIESGIAPDRIAVITNAVCEIAAAERDRKRTTAREQLRVRSDEFVFGYVGRLSQEKGLEFLIGAAQPLSSSARAWRLLIVGDGPQRDELTRMARDLCVADRIKFLGFQRDPSLWYAAMDAFVLPSLTEGTPMALLEAMANHLPVIASAVGGVPAILSDGENGLMVGPGDPAHLYQAMDRVLNDGGLRTVLSNGAADSVRRRFDVGSWIRNVREVYTSVLEKRRVAA